mgnify:CR=1 FL=1
MFILYKENAILILKKTWKKLDGQTVRLKQILDKNGAPAPKSNYYFPYQKYSDNLWKLLDNLPDL